MIVQKRDAALDCIRVVAILSVIVVHIAPSTVPIPQLAVFQEIGSLGVPLFVILTGYLMVDRDYNSDYLLRFIQRNLLPMFICLELWNVIWYILDRIFDSTEPARYYLKIALFLQVPKGPFWFLPMIFGLYLGIPLTSYLLHHFLAMKSHAYLYILMGCLLLTGTLIPTTNYVRMIMSGRSGLSSVLEMNIFGVNAWGGSVWMLYLLIGFGIQHFSSQLDKRLSTPWCLTGFVFSFFALLLFHLWARSRRVDESFFYTNVLVIVCSTFLFLALHKLNGLLTGLPRLSYCLARVSKLSFGVYMLHFWIFRALSSMAHSWFGLDTGYFLFVVLVFVCYLGSLVSVWVLSYIPLFRKWLLLMK